VGYKQRVTPVAGGRMAFCSFAPTADGSETFALPFGRAAASQKLSCDPTSPPTPLSDFLPNAGADAQLASWAKAQRCACVEAAVPPLAQQLTPCGSCHLAGDGVRAGCFARPATPS
jgi:hypothetical protein